METDNMIEVTGLNRSLPVGGRELKILRGVSFAISSGEWVALTGPSGSGKTTLLGLLAGIDRPSSGYIRIDGVDLNTLSETRLARLRNEKIGIIFQAFYLIQSMTALENVVAPLYAGPHRRFARNLAKSMLEQVGLGDRIDHLPRQLSGGEQQRVAIARALVNNAPILMADEPTGNLDTKTSIEIMELLVQLNRDSGTTIILVTHESDIAAFSKRIIRFVDGHVVSDEEVKKS